MSSNNNQRKRSRWGAASTTSGAVSEDEAVRALQSEARERQRQQHLEDERRRKQQYEEQRRKRCKWSNDDDRSARKEDFDQSGSSRRDGSRNARSNNGDDYYGPPSAAKHHENVGGDADADADGDKKKELPNFGLSGALSRDKVDGNTKSGVLLKFQEPPEARTPNTQWRLYVFKGESDTPVETLHISKQSAYLVGRNSDICDIPVAHASCSSQHAVLQYRALPSSETGQLVCRPYIMDLESTNGTFLNGVRLDAARYYQMKKGDVLKFGASTREYVLLTANTTSIG